MKDLDFDELDRAVNSLIANGSNSGSDSVVNNTTKVESNLPKTPINSHFATNLTPAASPSVTPASLTVDKSVIDSLTASEEPKPVEASSVATSQEVAKEETSQTKPIPTIPIFVEEPVKPLASRRNSGRFMDVMHPSSDMRTTLVMPDRISRQGNSLSPLSQSNVTEQKHEPVSIALPQPEPVELLDIATEPEPELEPDIENWSKPVEPVEKIEISLPVPENTDTDEDDDIDRISDDIDKTLNQTPDIQESPFLSGAKVEKRPLGAFSNDAAVDYIETTPIMSDSITDEKSSEDEVSALIDKSSQVDTEMPLPAELMGDLLSIEAADEVVEPAAPVTAPVIAAQPIASTSTAEPIAAVEPSPALSPNPVAPASPVSIPTPAPISTPAPAAVVSPVPQPVAPKPVEPAAVAAVVTPKSDGPTSIAQQYQEKPSTGDQNSAAIYDTAAYHKAIVGKPSKKSNLFLIVWILSVLAIGGGIGAVIYFFVVPLL